MVEWTKLSYNRLPQQPLPAYVVQQNVAGRYKLSSKRGDSKPLREIPGIQKELKRNPGTTGFLAARKRKGEDDQTITQKHPARGNSAASSSHEPSYHDSTAASSTDTRHNKTRSEFTLSSNKDWWTRGFIPHEDVNSKNEVPWESRAETSIRTESQKYVQQRDAAGQKPTPFYGDPDFNLKDNDKGKPKPEWHSSQWKETKSSAWQPDRWDSEHETHSFEEYKSHHSHHQEEQYEYKKNANWYTTSGSSVTNETCKGKP